MRPSVPGDVQPRLPDPPLRIFVNRNLRMDTIKAVGFDMDYTLARYSKEHMEALAHRVTIDKLIERGYPEEIRRLEYDRDFVIRGLTVDKQLGNIIKLDRHNHAGRAMHGRRKLSKRERRRLYRSERIHFSGPRFAVGDTLFSLPEMCLYADLVELFESRADLHPDPWQTFDDTRECIDEAHRDDTLKSVIKGDLDSYVERDPLLCRTLHKLRSGGKKLFLLTNSHWDYTAAVMSYLLDGDLREYPTWQRYFELIVVAAHKPGFFTGGEPFAALDSSGTVLERPAVRLEKGRAYQGGNRKELERFLGFSGDEILYVGDHIYGDILRSKKASLWRTALVVEELEREIRVMNENRRVVDRLAALENERRELDDLALLEAQGLAGLKKTIGLKNTRGSAKFETLRKARDRTKRRLKKVLREIETLEADLDRAFNDNWGMVFKEARENSRFGEQVTDYACLYTSRVSNFLGYSTHQYFRGPRDLMPHERLV
ncbi:MAG: HAD-IG family 5'-nucleotidase [Myxococcota bacterium]